MFIVMMILVIANGAMHVETISHQSDQESSRLILVQDLDLPPREVTPQDFVASVIASFDTLDDHDDTNNEVEAIENEVVDSMGTTSDVHSQASGPRPGKANNYRYQYVNEGSVILRSFGNDSTCSISPLLTTTWPLNICQGSSSVATEGSHMTTLLVSQHRKTKATTWTLMTSVYIDLHCVQLHHAHVTGHYTAMGTCHQMETEAAEAYVIADLVRE